MCGGSRAWCDREGFAAIHSSDNCSLVARQAAMAVQDTQITVFHESAAQGGGRGTVRRELLVFIRFTPSSFSPM